MCRQCGAIVGAGESQCGMCGASTAPQQRPAHAQMDHETMRFARAVLNRPYKFAIILLIANLFMFLLMWQSSGLSSQVLWQGFSERVLDAYGAKVNGLIQAGEWWRFVTPMFIHVNLPHLLVNMYSLWVVGPYVERLYGSARFVVFWVLTGIAGVVGSYLTVRPNMPNNFFGRFFFKAHDVPSAGASGALFGLVGVLFVFGIKFRHELPDGFKRAFGTGMLPIILINLFIGYIGRGVIDNAAHVGGLLSGAALALVVQYRRPGERKGVAVIWRVLQVMALGLVAICFFQVARHLSLPPAAQMQNVQVKIENPSFLIYANAMNQAQETLGQVLHDNDPSGIDASIKALDEAPTVDPKADELKLRLKELLTRAKTQALSPASAATQKDKSHLVQDVTVWSKEYGEWLKTTAGLVPVTDPSP